MTTLHQVTADEWRDWREMRLLALAEAPYAFESTLEQWQGEGDYETRWRDRLNSVALNVMARLEGRFAGMVSGVVDDSHVELISLWVAPFARGRGVGDALIDEVVRRAASLGHDTVVLRVKEPNDHAVSLYRRHDFVDSVATGETNAPPTSDRLMVRHGSSLSGSPVSEGRHRRSS